MKDALGNQIKPGHRIAYAVHDCGTTTLRFATALGPTKTGRGYRVQPDVGSRWDGDKIQATVIYSSTRVLILDKLVKTTS